METIGDSYMVVANITSPCPDHVDQLLRFAIGMQEAAARVHDKQGESLKIRVGESCMRAAQAATSPCHAQPTHLAIPRAVTVATCHVTY